MSIERPAYLDWLRDDLDDEDDEELEEEDEDEEHWEYRDFKEYPPGDAPKETILDFVKDTLRAQKKFKNDLMDSGLDEESAEKKSCLWPLKSDAPMEIVRGYIGYCHDLEEAAKEGADI